MNVPFQTSRMPVLKAGDAIKMLQAAPVANLNDITDGKPILVIAPHSDDETLGCGGLIALCAAADTDVTVAIMTDGSRSHPNSVEFNPQMRRDIREQEVRLALNALGAHDAKLVYFRRPDGYLESSGEDADNMLQSLSDLVKSSDCHSVFVTWGADPHPDHIASYKLVQKLSAMHEDVLFFAYPIWALSLAYETEITAPFSNPVRLEIRQVKDKKRKAIDCFATQVKNLIHDDPDGFQLTSDHIDLFCRDFEYFIEFGQSSLTELPRLSSVPTEHFEKLYEKSLDPWDYKNNNYEQNRFDITLKSLPCKNYKNGCEIGCSIGILTKKLSVICKNLIGIDCSSTAIEQAEKNLAGIGNVEFKLMRVPEELPTGTYDLIVLSEVLYFFSEKDLKAISCFVIQKLEIDGICLLVNFLGDTESPMSGNEVASKFCSLTSHNLMAVSTKEYDGFRIDVLTKIT